MIIKYTNQLQFKQCKECKKERALSALLNDICIICRGGHYE